MMFEYKEPSQVVGVYLPEGEEIYSNTRQVSIDEKWERFTPIIKGFSKVMTEDFVLANIKDRGNSINTYDRNMTYTSIRPDLVKENMIDITRSDMLITSDIILLNFTDNNLVASLSNGLKKIMPPVTTNKLSEFRGKVIIIEVTTLNTTDFVSKTDGTDDYIAAMIAEINNHPDVDEAKSDKIKKIYFKAKELMDRVISERGEFKANSAKVINVLELDGGVITKLCSSTPVYIPEYHLLLTREKIINAPLNPSFLKFSELSLEEINMIRNNKLQVSIKDNNNKIGPRFMVFAGHVMEIPRLTSSFGGEGLNINIRLENGERVSEIIPLDEIDNVSYIFKTQEEAKAGLNKLDIAEEELRKRKEDFERYKIEKEREMHEFRHKVEEERARRDREKAEFEREREREKAKYEREREREKAEFEREKVRYQREKEEREREWEERMREWESRKQEVNIDRERVDYERERTKAELEARKEILKAEIAKYEHKNKKEHDEIKYSHELRKADAENTLQTLKVIGGVLALGGIAYTIYRKLNS